MIRRVIMKLSENTVNILKNFSTINQNILVKEGSQLRTMSTMKNILGEAGIIDKRIGIPMGFVFFYLSLDLIYQEYAKESEL